MKCSILDGRTIRHKGKFLTGPAEVELPEGEAERLVALGYVAQHKAKKTDDKPKGEKV